MPVAPHLWHGRAGDPAWPAPQCVRASSKAARPGYDCMDASEYVDHPAVLEAKVALLAALVAQSRELCAYTGAGLSTAAGIADYASRAEGSLALEQRTVQCGGARSTLRALVPTAGHQVLAALGRAGKLRHWVNQNHDGLAQKAACPPELVNELHGGWFDARNSVVKMSGSLRDDLYDRMEHSAAVADVVLALGTSLSGLAADEVATNCAERASLGLCPGLCVVALQRTKQDGAATLRIFAKLDDVLLRLAQHLKLELPTPADMRQAQARPGDWYTYMYDPPTGTYACGGATFRYKQETQEQMYKRCGRKAPAQKVSVKKNVDKGAALPPVQAVSTSSTGDRRSARAERSRPWAA